MGPNHPEQIVAALVDDEVGAVDEKKSSVRRKSVGEERDIEDDPGGERGPRDRLPRLVEPELIKKRMQEFEHGLIRILG